MTEKIIFYFFAGILTVASLTLLLNVSDSFMIRRPTYGGTLTEGVIGSPRFINPILATGDANLDLTSLIYSGLLKPTPDGTLIPDLAESYTVSPEGLVYTFTLKRNAFFQDGTKVTADDILFTIDRAQDPNLKSPRRANWEGVTAEKIDDRTVQFTLKQAYAPFLENTTLGILPKHIWQNVSIDSFPFSEANVKPIGSGPYEIASVKRTTLGAPISYTLNSFDRYALGRPYIQTLIIKFYNNESDLVKALSNGEIESAAGISPQKATELKKMGTRLETSPLPRVFGVFFNQNQASVLVNKEVRLALTQAIDKDALVTDVLQGFGKPLSGPVPPTLVPEIDDDHTFSLNTNLSGTEKAKNTLLQAGWKYSSTTGELQKKVGKKTIALEFSLSTGNAPELKAAAENLKTSWEKIGAKVNVKIFEPGDLDQNVIRPRKYDALLFGEVVGRDLDLFAFWHSSQRLDPGLNIALYTNIKADKLLEDARGAQSENIRNQKILLFEKEIDKDVPAVFLYAPDFIYALPPKIAGFKLGTMTIPADRFSGIEKWYIDTEKVWSIFNRS